jgi:hypothetical protein
MLIDAPILSTLKDRNLVSTTLPWLTLIREGINVTPSVEASVTQLQRNKVHPLISTHVE